MVLVFLLRETKIIRGYRDFLQRTAYEVLNKSDKYGEIEGRVIESDSFSEIESKIPFKIDKPAWLPEGYELEKIIFTRFITEEYTLQYTYKMPEQDMDALVFAISTSSNEDMEEGITVDYEVTEINGTKTVIIEDIYSNAAQANYYNNQGLLMYINCPLGKETLIKIIENMD